MCGPTASGKSDLSDAIAERISEAYREDATTLVVDSMQVYREIPTITNQSRRRQAEMVGVASVTEEWSVARHRNKSVSILSRSDIPFVLDAGTGMYLNALLLDIDLAPKVPPEVRAAAEAVSRDTINPRRESRDLELELAGAEKKGSIWDGELRYETAILYLRPERGILDRNIERRTDHIIQNGVPEAEQLRELVGSAGSISLQVSSAIGVKEMLEHVSGSMAVLEAQSLIAARTRQLARRQLRWFDKLIRSVSDRANIEVIESVTDATLAKILHTLHDTIGS